KNLEDYWYQQRGRALTQITNQGFQEKLVGKRWKDVPMPTGPNQVQGQSFFTMMRQALVRTLSTRETNTYKGLWKHPAKGRGQICESLERGIVESGGRIIHQAQVLDIAASAGMVRSVTAKIDSETVTFEPANLISSTPAEFLHQMLLG